MVFSCLKSCRKLYPIIITVILTKAETDNVANYRPPQGAMNAL